jgi:hypothetical protein
LHARPVWRFFGPPPVPDAKRRCAPRGARKAQTGAREQSAPQLRPAALWATRRSRPGMPHDAAVSGGWPPAPGNSEGATAGAIPKR